MRLRALRVAGLVPSGQGQRQHAVVVFGLGLAGVHIGGQRKAAGHLAKVAPERSTFRRLFCWSCWRTSARRLTTLPSSEIMDVLPWPRRAPRRAVAAVDSFTSTLIWAGEGRLSPCRGAHKSRGYVFEEFVQQTAATGIRELMVMLLEKLWNSTSLAHGWHQTCRQPEAGNLHHLPFQFTARVLPFQELPCRANMRGLMCLKKPQPPPPRRPACTMPHARTASHLRGKTCATTPGAAPPPWRP